MKQNETKRNTTKQKAKQKKNVGAENDVKLNVKKKNYIAKATWSIGE